MVEPEIKTCVVSVAVIVVTTLLSDSFLRVMLPVPATTVSEKVRTRLEAMATAVASSAGEEEDRVGAVVSNGAPTLAVCPVKARLFKRTLVLSELRFAVMISSLPSPLISPKVTEFGLFPVAKVA